MTVSSANGAPAANGSLVRGAISDASARPAGNTCRASSTAAENPALSFRRPAGPFFSPRSERPQKMGDDQGLARRETKPFSGEPPVGLAGQRAHRNVQVSETGLPFAVSCARKSMGSLPDGTKSNRRRCVPPVPATGRASHSRTSPAEGCYIRTGLAAAAVGAAFHIEVDDESGLSRFRLPNSVCEMVAFLFSTRRVPAPMHAIAFAVPEQGRAPLSDARSKRCFRSFSSVSRQFDKIDGTLAPVSDRLDPKRRPDIELRSAS